MVNWNEVREMQDEAGAAFGDGRRCSRHPNVVIGSPCGMFDGVCGICECESEDEAEADRARDVAAHDRATERMAEVRRREVEAEREETARRWAAEEFPF